MNNKYKYDLNYIFIDTDISGNKIYNKNYDLIIKYSLFQKMLYKYNDKTKNFENSNVLTRIQNRLKNRSDSLEKNKSIEDLYSKNDSTDFLEQAQYELNSTISNFSNCQDDMNNEEWIECKDRCNQLAKEYIHLETQSTFFILKCIADSILTVNNYENDGNTEIEKKSLIKFEINKGVELTGLWELDNDKIEIYQIGPLLATKYIQNSILENAIKLNKLQNKNNKTEYEINEMKELQIIMDMIKTNFRSRLVMGFGPSAAGKTYWSKNILTILKNINSYNPSVCISIDGGSFRESSQIYLIIRDLALKNCKAGFSNLVGDSILTESLFAAGHIKKAITKYLYKNKDKIKISLYVPETLGDCGRSIMDKRLKICNEKYKNYIDITNDKEWIGLMIWQHNTGLECSYNVGFRCKGCTESGKEREKKEGKKYSNSNWEHSCKMGVYFTFEAPGGRYIIHNSGGRKTLYEQYSSIGKEYEKTQYNKTSIIDCTDKKYKTEHYKKSFLNVSDMPEYNFKIDLDNNFTIDEILKIVSTKFTDKSIIRTDIVVNNNEIIKKK